MQRIVIAEAAFDGERLHRGAATAFVVVNGIVEAVVPAHELGGLQRDPGVEVERAAFVLPGLVDAHVHLFLDGGELDTAACSAYLQQPVDAMVAVAMRNAQRSLALGITAVRDAGDRYGVNHRLRAAAVARGAALPAVRSAGIGLKRPRRYGAFMGLDVAGDDEIVAAVRRLAAECDDIKLILTGIIDFEACTVPGEPQFDAAAATLVVRTAHELGRRVFAHCSGERGLEVAIAAGVDSVEHGFLMRDEMIGAIAERGIAWTPTFAPVQFQRDRPEVAGWPTPTVQRIRALLNAHAVQVKRAWRSGVTLLCGSDAGSNGVVHGDGLHDEIQALHAAGLPVDAVLRAATSAPREHWSQRARLERGSLFDAVLLDASPFDRLGALRQPRAVYRSGARHPGFAERGGAGGPDWTATPGSQPARSGLANGV